MKFIICTLLVLGFEQAITAGPLALLGAAASHPAVIAGTASYVGTRLANRGNGGSQPSDMSHVMESLYNRAQQCVAENGNLRETVGYLRRDANDLNQARKELRDRETENRQLVAQQIGLQVDNRHQAATIERLSTEKQELRHENTELRKDIRELAQQPVPSSMMQSIGTKPLLALGGVACCATAVAYVAGQKIASIERRVQRDPVINWQPKGTRDVRSLSPDKLAHALAHALMTRHAPITAPVTPVIIIKLIEEIQKRIRMLQEYLAWKPWQSSVLAPSLGLEEEKFNNAEEKLTRLFALQSQLHRALDTAPEDKSPSENN